MASSEDKYSITEAGKAWKRVAKEFFFFFIEESIAWW